MNKKRLKIYRIMAINIDKTNNKGNISVYFKGLQNKSAGEIVDLVKFDIKK